MDNHYDETNVDTIEELKSRIIEGHKTVLKTDGENMINKHLIGKECIKLKSRLKINKINFTEYIDSSMEGIKLRSVQRYMDIARTLPADPHPAMYLLLQRQILSFSRFLKIDEDISDLVNGKILDMDIDCTDVSEIESFRRRADEVIRELKKKSKTTAKIMESEGDFRKAFASIKTFHKYAKSFSNSLKEINDSDDLISEIPEEAMIDLETDVIKELEKLKNNYDRIRRFRVESIEN